MLSKKAIRVIAIVLAALMALSVFAVIFQIVGLDENAVAAAIPATGESNLPYLIPAIVIGCAVIAILCAVLIPKLKKNKKAQTETADETAAEEEAPEQNATEEPKTGESASEEPATEGEES